MGHLAEPTAFALIFVAASAVLGLEDVQHSGR
jgi:hypothetical protein